jgi:Tripartite tricarboxylate transporter TctB family
LDTDKRHTALSFSQDMWASLTVAIIAVVAMVMAGDLDYGSLAEIGPGLFPFALAAILLGLCLALFVQNWRAPGEHVKLPDRKAWRAMACILGGLVVFAVTMRGADLGPLHIPSLGVVGATPLAILLAGLADPSTRWLQLAGFAVALTTFCAVLFRMLLGLPLPLAPWLVGY